MKFRLEFDIKEIPWPIGHQHSLFLLGSCFTENIGDKLRKHKFNVLENPHGILFNPISVAEAINDYIEATQYDGSALFQLNEAWHSWKHHSRFSHPDKASSIKLINASIGDAHEFLKKTDHLLITLGSSWVYTLTDKAAKPITGSVAANNHKAPADWFQRKLMLPGEVIELFQKTIERLRVFNPGLKIIFTISPVRHLREGVIDNNRSKAVLIQAVHRLTEQYDHLYYFPAYELVLDDLRDYRFYAEDLVHPNYHATQYVWERFVNACMNEATRSLMEEISQLNLAFNHKPFNVQSSQHRLFLKTNLEKAIQLRSVHPFLNFDKEIAYFSSGI